MLKLTGFTDYALRTLQLAALQHERLIRVDDVTRIHRLARPHVVKVVHELGQAGFLVTQRGRGGGFKLARPAEDITLGEVLRATEGPMHLVECFDTASNTCILSGICRMQAVLHKASHAFLQELDQVTLADVTVNRAELRNRMLAHTPDDGGNLRPI